MAKMAGWRIYYDNGSVFSSLDGEWKDAPNDGIQILVEFYEDGSKILHVEREYYILDEGKAYGTNNLHPWLRKYGQVKFGRWFNNDGYKRLLELAKKEGWKEDKEVGVILPEDPISHSQV